MKGTRKLTPKGAVWSALFATPVFLIAALMLIGVTAGSAGPSKAEKTPVGAAATAADLTHHDNGQTVAQVRNFWTPESMVDAQPYAMPAPAGATAATGSVQSVPQASGAPGAVTMKAGGGVELQTFSTQQAAGALTEPFHAAVPYTQWQWFGRYLRNVGAGSPNLVVSAQSKMFFTQDHDGNGSTSNFVCSASTIGQDAVWTAGHCLANGLNGVGANGGFSTNILFCPSWDNGAVNPSAGCWGATDFFVSTTWFATGDLDRDFGATDTNFPAIAPAAGLIGDFTGWLGLAWNWGNQNWVAMGYPAAPPFTGNKIEVCASSLGYVDSGGPATPDSVAIGCDMTGGSSGGPWILGFGRFPTQPGGNAPLWINGHNDWRHTAVVNELNSPYYDCFAVVLYNAINETAIACP